MLLLSFGPLYGAIGLMCVVMVKAAGRGQAPPRKEIWLDAV